MTTTGKVFTGVVAVGLVGGFIYESQLFRKHLKYSLDNIQIDKEKTIASKFQFVFITVTLRLFNPVHFPVPWVMFHGTVDLNGVQLGSAITRSFTLPGNSNSTLKIPVVVSTGHILEQVISLLDGNEHTVTLDAAINSLFGTIPITGSKTIEL